MPSSKWIRALVALAIIASPALARAAAPAPGRNLLLNPGFERTLAGHEWMPAGWDTSNSGLATAFFGRDTLLPHGGSYSVNVANTSTLYPGIGNNWSQTLLVGREAWGKQAVFSIWTRSSGQQGRAYLLVQAYDDTVTRLARIWGVERLEARNRLGISAIEDPAVSMGWHRTQFEVTDTPWVRREASVFVPVGTNVIFVRAGLFGTGQLSLDDASLTLEPAPPPPVIPAHRNLLADPGFEEGALTWEYSIPPYEGARIDLDSTVAHGGRYSMRCWNMSNGLTDTRMGMCQRISARGLTGKRLRLTGWFRGDSLKSSAFVKIYTESGHVLVQSPGTLMLSGTFDWTQGSAEMDVPADATEIWAWLVFSAPAEGTVWIDDGDLEVVGPAAEAQPARPPAARHPKPSPKR